MKTFILSEGRKVNALQDSQVYDQEDNCQKKHAKEASGKESRKSEELGNQDHDTQASSSGNQADCEENGEACHQTYGPELLALYREQQPVELDSKLDSVQDEKGQEAPNFTQKPLCGTSQEVACMESQTGEKDFNHRASQNDKDVSASPEMVKNLSFPLDNPDLS